MAIEQFIDNEVKSNDVVLFMKGMWPLVFNDAPPGEEELEEAVVMMMLGVCTLFWGAMICFGASQMQELASYPWSLVGAIMGIPVLVGIYCVVMLQDPKARQVLAANGYEPRGGTPADFAKHLQSESDRWQKQIKATGVNFQTPPQ